jgi:hypothetical protein
MITEIKVTVEDTVNGVVRKVTIERRVDTKDHAGYIPGTDLEDVVRAAIEAMDPKGNEI